jgi:putative hemolysin
MIERSSTVTSKKESHLVLKQAVHESEIEAALRLRFEVFNLEMKEGLHSSYQTGLDYDEFDSLCDHIIVKDEEKNEVVGTYRLLLGSTAEKAHGYYSEMEFEMSAFKKLQGEKLELGRACVHKDYRGSAVLTLMWSGIAGYIDEYGIDHIFGCGSVHTINPAVIGSIYGYFKKNYLTAEDCRATPLKRVPGFDAFDTPNKRLIAQHLPPLLGAYLRLGARVAGEPAFDEQFGVSDFLILLDRDKLLSRYKDRFFSVR